jgi:hypothetical protein
MTAPVADPTVSPSEPGDPAEAPTPTGLTDPTGLQASATNRRHRPVDAWRRLRLPLALLAVFALAVALSVLLAPTPRSNVYLDPAANAPEGARALAVLLPERGFNLVTAYSPQAALSAIAAAEPSAGHSARHAPAVTLLITSPGLLTAGQRRQLATANADLVLAEPGAAALRSFAPAVRVAKASAPITTAAAPSCGLAAARLAGSASAGGTTYRPPSYATGCYPVDGAPSLVSYRARGRTITVLGNAFVLSDGALGSGGNAALALNLLSARPTVVWLTPEPKVVSAKAAPARRTAPPLIPMGAWLVVLQLLVALMITIIWRARRLGPLIIEPLPVVVRASETVEGHARLYEARRSRDRAAAIGRAAMLGRVIPLLGLARDAPPEAVVDAVALRSTLTRDRIQRIGYGPAPASDAELVQLANDLDELERQVRAQ